MGDYRDYRVIVTYDGGISLSALDTADAERIAREIMLEETNPDMAKYLNYKIEEIN